MGKWTDGALKKRAVMDEAGTLLTDKEALSVSSLYKKWRPDTEYMVDDRRRYNGVLYRCLQKHTSQETWNPEDSPSLWAKVLIPDPDVIPDWEQPDSTNPYQMGDKVKHNGKVWESIVDNNSWEPGVYGWQEVAE